MTRPIAIRSNGEREEFTDDEYAQYLIDQQAGQPTREQNIATVLAEARVLRAKLFAVVDGLQASALTTGNSADATAIEAFKVGLRNITAVSFENVADGLSQADTLKQLRLVVKTQYAAITAPAPASVKAAFKAAQS